MPCCLTLLGECTRPVSFVGLWNSQSYAPSDTQTRYPGAPNSLLHQSDVIQLLRALVRHVNPTYPNHQYFLTEVAPILHELFPLCPSTVKSPTTIPKSGGGVGKTTPRDQQSRAKRDPLTRGHASSPSSEPKRTRPDLSSSTVSPEKLDSLPEPCLRHVAALFNVEGTPRCENQPCPYLHHSSKKTVPAAQALAILARRPPRSFPKEAVETLVQRLTKRSVMFTPTDLSPTVKTPPADK